MMSSERDNFNASKNSRKRVHTADSDADYLETKKLRYLNDDLCAIQTISYTNKFPHQLIELMYQLDLSMLCSIRQHIYSSKYRSLSITYGDSQIDNFRNIVLRYKKKSIHINVKYIDKYCMSNGIGYTKLFTKDKRNFSINDYFNSFVKFIISKSEDVSLKNIKYLIVYTNAGLNITEEGTLKESHFKYFYPFKFDKINLEEHEILNDFLFTNDNTQDSGFYQFSHDIIMKEELFKRLDFTFSIKKAIKDKLFSEEFEKEIKKKFLKKILFAVNQPNREELSSLVKLELSKSNGIKTSDISLYEKILLDLIALKKLKEDTNISENITTLNLVMSFLHTMFLQKNIYSINIDRKGSSNDIIINYKDRLTYVKAYSTNSKISYCQLFSSKRRKKKATFTINKHFTIFVEELKQNLQYFVIYTNTDLQLTGEMLLQKGRSKEFYPIKFDRIDIRKKKFKILRDCYLINEGSLYQFAKEETTRETLLGLLQLPPVLQKEKNEEKLSNAYELELKEKFLDGLIFATNQPDRENLIKLVKCEIDKSDVPYNYEELREIALRWSDSQKFDNINKKIIKQLYDDIKNNRSSFQKMQHANVKEEIQFAKSVVGREETPAFSSFLNFLIDGDGKRYFEDIKKAGLDLANMSSILHVSGANAVKSFQALYILWIDETGNKSFYLKTLEKEKINLSNMSSILGGSGKYGATAFKELYDLWFDADGDKTKYLQTLEKEGINITTMSSILSGSGANASNAFKGLYKVWFNKRGSKSHYLNILEKEGINLSNISSILNVAGANAAKAFTDLYELCFDQEGNKTKYLRTLEDEGVTLTNMSSILSGAGANATKAFKALYELWFSEDVNKTFYLNKLKDEGINFVNISSILSGSGANAAKAFKELYDFWFDEDGNKTKYLKCFLDDKYKNKCFTLHNLSGILSKSGTNAKEAFERLYNICFNNNNGKRTELLEDFYIAGFRPSNLSCLLCGSGLRASVTLKRMHSICFNEERESTKYLNNFFMAGFRPCDLCGVLSAAANSLKKLHDFCFMAETKIYLSHFLIEDGFTPRNLSKILHGAGANICFVLKDFHDICFDDTGQKSKILNDFYGVGFSSSVLSNILSLAGNNAASNLRKFHKLCFNKKNLLKHFLAEKELISPKDLSQVLYGRVLINEIHLEEACLIIDIARVHRRAD